MIKLETRKLEHYSDGKTPDLLINFTVGTE